ncbi:hypothetical protein AArcSl_1624 [Halalkaliarchaeum desulfuricum]|uniref:Restriction endonuclease n=1 Tax=Halalkaliarchaeum desulfuricum TaxID=2055893 RepID=A0A343TJI1_9EURY|nr:hypothetical protein [Halalkaliarchaeum desulfuricum]AUX09253.1 hypothetical protein AArcSl_1624 [Halalkaliarchaeum desulfuricum]
MADYSGDPSEFKVYWFARDLVASSYGSFATKETTTLKQLSSRIEQELESNDSLNRTDLETQKEQIRDTITGSVNRTYGGDISKRYRQTEDLAERILRRIEEEDDIRELRIAIDAVVRTSEILDTAPSFGKQEIVNIVDETLQNDQGTLDPSKAYDALYSVDFDGEAYQLGAQREPLIDYVYKEMEELRADPRIEEKEIARIISGIVQEYERRAGQSRASTAGNVLETGLQHIFNQFGIPATGDSAHFGDLEIDNMVDGPDGSIGFSCKRTLRERFRQSLSREAEIAVDEVWFVSLLMADVSKEKLRDISNDGSRIYVPRDSFVWDQYHTVDDLSYTLRPADQFIEDVVEFTGVSSHL